MAAETHRKQYVFIFLWLTFLTLLEVGVVYVDVSRGTLISALVLMAIAKAALVAYYYMHLGHETRLMRRIVSYCLGLPAVYASVLVLEGAWRMLR